MHVYSVQLTSSYIYPSCGTGLQTCRHEHTNVQLMFCVQSACKKLVNLCTLCVCTCILCKHYDYIIICQYKYKHIYIHNLMYINICLAILCSCKNAGNGEKMFILITCTTCIVCICVCVCVQSSIYPVLYVHNFSHPTPIIIAISFAGISQQ